METEKNTEINITSKSSKSLQLSRQEGWEQRGDKGMVESRGLRPVGTNNDDKERDRQSVGQSGFILLS